MDRPALLVGTALVRALLRLYPAPFRERYGEELEEAFRAQARARLARRGLRALPGLWARTVWGMTRGALAERAPGTHTDGGTTMGGGGVVSAIATETRQAARRLRRSPVFTGLAVATLGLGVGAFAAVYAVVESVLVEPLPFEEPDELMWVWRDYRAFFDLSRGWLGGPDVAYLQEANDAFAGASAIRSARLNLTGRSGLEPREVRTFMTSAGFFDLLGVAPAAGRGFLPGEDEPGAPAVAVLGHALWVEAFGGARDILGREVRLDGEPYTVVGVLPDDFHFAMATSLGDPAEAELYVPLRMDLAAQDAGSGFLAGLVRIGEGASADRVEASLAGIADQVDEGWEGGALRLWTAPMKEDLVGGVRSALLAILAAAGFLLLVLGANLATLLMARATTGRRDAAVRTALGAGRAAVAGTVVAEGAILAAAGGAVAVLLGARGAELLGRVAGDAVPRSAEVTLDATGVAVALAVTALLVAAAIVGPVVRVVGSGPAQALREAGVTGGESRRGVRSRGTMVVAQVALSIVLLVGAGLLTRSLAGLLRVDPGFDPAGTLTARLALDGNAYPDDPAVLELLDRLQARLAALPGVEAVGASNALPMSASTNQTTVVFPGAPGNTGDADEDQPLVDVMRVTSTWFGAAGLRVLEGRPFARGGRSGGAADGAPEVVIDDVLANHFFPGRSALGGRVRLGADTASVVGVVDHARAYEVDRDGRGQVYASMALDATTGINLALRVDAGDGGGRDPLALAGPLRSVVRELDPSVPVSEVRTLDAVVARALRGERLNLALVGSFALAALLLAALGVYGVVANAVVRRRPEIGVRMALGAGSGEVVRMVLGQGLRLVAIGVVVGLVGAGLVSRFLASLLHEVAPFDPATYTAVAALLVALAAVAAWLPARRATRVPPADALRAE